MKKILCIAAFALTILLSACSGSNESAGAEEKKKLVFGATIPYSDMLEKGVKPQLEKLGYEVEIKEFNDYVQPNLSLANGSLDANLFQHRVYLEAFAKEHSLNLAEVIDVPTAPIGVYSNKVENLEDLPEGSQIAIANDPTNLARHLGVLSKAGLITFSDGIDPLRATVKDIQGNPKKFTFVEMEAAQLPRSLSSVDAAAVNGNFAISAGLDLTKALVLDVVAPEIHNRIVIRTEDKEKKYVKDIKKAVESAEFKKVIDEDFKGFHKPEWLAD
ncbi:hypothetical protein GJU40_19175 [Bacillus lacus]|uniref:Lipoprotein n=1 Tax=Metabacillus lacus TaxID=1983721 RepID=A0A7X2J2N7_9BACI|nr:MetQ/NlpA family ABC transporter substrate-binding protein [Metabacillus lacus]MRX74246.1 hypothetical protein [Metabacillus lacus]